jgi:two-component system, chemotaxis family, response regulator Rcp1
VSADAEEKEPIHILLVEDNPGYSLLLAEAFESAQVPHTMYVACGGREAVDYLRGKHRCTGESCPDLVLLDLNLTGKGGHEVLAEIKTDPDLSRIPVVVMSGSAEMEDVAKAYDLHANCYVVKPMAFDHLVKMVGSIGHFWTGVAVLPPTGPTPRITA